MTQFEVAELHDLPQVATHVSASLQQTMLDTSTMTISEDSPLREILVLDKTLQTFWGELVNNLAKLTDLDEHIALQERENAKLSELTPEAQVVKGRAA